MTTYHQIIQATSFEERFKLLYEEAHLDFRDWGMQRGLNQAFYHSDEWRSLRNSIIIRDGGCNLAHPDYAISKRFLIHHIMPLTIEDIQNGNMTKLLDPENLILTNDYVHNAIHYGDGTCPYTEIVVRTPYDTCPWRK